MEVLILIFTGIGLIPVFFLFRDRYKKRFKLDLDYRNISFSLFHDQQNDKLNNRFCLVVYFLHIVNTSLNSITLKNINLSYCFGGRVYEDESYVVKTGDIPDVDEPNLLTTNGIDTIFLMRWKNLRTEIGKHEVLQPGGVFNGSGVFLFESSVNDLSKISKLKLTISDYNGKKITFPIAIKDSFFTGINKGFAVINRSFRITGDKSIEWK